MSSWQVRLAATSALPFEVEARVALTAVATQRWPCCSESSLCTQYDGVPYALHIICHHIHHTMHTKQG